MIQCHYEIIEIKKKIHTTGHDSPKNAFSKNMLRKNYSSRQIIKDK